MIARPFLVLLVAFLLMTPPMVASAGHHEAKSSGEKKAAPAADDVDRKQPDPLMRPNLAKEKAPASFKVRFETTKGDVLVEVTRAWSPNGADRVYNLVKLGYYTDIAFFRVIPGFMAQFGMHGTPRVMRVWERATIKDDAVVESNRRGMISFAKTGRPHSRNTQLFINLSDNTNLDGMGFSPIGRVIEGMDIVDQIYQIGEGAPRGRGPDQRKIKREGNEYLRRDFPKLDYLERATIVE